MLVALISLGGFFEMYELFFTAYITPGLIKSGILTSTTQSFFGFSGIGAFIAATFAGLFVGTFFLGFLPDRYGRRFVFTYSLLWYTVCTVIMAFQTTADGVLLWRFIAGIGIGVEIVTIDAYITELVPAHMRGRAFALNQAVMFSAVPTVALLSWWLVPLAPLDVEGWRWVIMIGAAGAVVIWFIRRAVPESPRWLAQNGWEEEAERVTARIEDRVSAEYGQPLPSPVPSATRVKPGKASFSEIWTAPYKTYFLMLIVFNFFQTIGYYGFANWVPTLLVAKDITVTKSLFYSFIIAIAYPIGPLLAMTFADRVERKWVIVGAAFCIAVIGATFSQLTTPALLIVCGVLMTFANNTLSYAYHAYQAEVFPVRIRGRAAGITYSASRVGAMSSGFLIAFFLKEYGVNGVFALITGAMIVVMASIGIFGPRIKDLDHEVEAH
jgi:putative MFS transporter